MSYRWFSKGDTMIFDSIRANTVKCKCGHSVVVNQKRKMCSWCGHWVYKDAKDEFMDKLKSQMKRG